MSLNIDTRKQERAEVKAKRLERENIRRAAQGKELIKEIDEETELVEVDDVKLNETANILSDLIRLKTQSAVAQIEGPQPNS